MDVFNYELFNAHYNTLKNIIGEGESNPSTINGVISNSNRSILEGLEYAENSAWASSKLNEWNELMPLLIEQLNNLITLLEKAKAVSDSYNQFEQSNTGIKS